MNTPTIRYLRLLQQDDPDRVLADFVSLVNGEPGFEASVTDVSRDELSFSDVVTVTDEGSGEIEEFLRWWVEEYRQNLAGKLDSLTGLLSRDYWDRDLKYQVQDSIETRSILMLDIDHFKEINDTYGHRAGDEVLSGTGRILRDELGERNTVIRYGGEEFLSVLNASRDETLRLAETVRNRMAETDFFEEQPGPVTVSVGVSVPGDNDPVDLGERIEEADLALYSAKSDGRNQVTVFAPYMRHRQQLSVWGFYRYLWSTDVRFGFCPDTRSFLLYRGGELLRYSWSDNDATVVSVLEELEHPVRTIESCGAHWLLLDAAGDLWSCDANGILKAFGEEQSPRLVALSGIRATARAVGINSQVYEVSDGGLDRVGSLSDDWETFLHPGSSFYVSQGNLYEWSPESTRWISSLPEPAQDFTVDDNRLVMSSSKGKLYQFNCELDHWKELKFPDLFGESIRVQNVCSQDDSYLFKDESGRLILARKEGKSVPQEMNLPATN